MARTMDFFAHQDSARKRTSYLVFLFILAVAVIIATVYAAYVAIFIYYGHRTGNPVPSGQYWFPDAFMIVAGATVGVVMIGSLWKTAQLRGGGKAVATSLGGRRVPTQTDDPRERRLLNVVEEIAIASGTPVPPVYVLDHEDGINAFAAGFAPSDAVVGVTRGCVDKLTRSELQGVIAHEFSHVLNGDMRLNIRLMGVLHGILALAIIGYWTMRMSFGGSRHRRSSSRKGGGGAAAIALFGLVVMIVGYIGVLFGKLIKSAVSRQREFLADAAAVQFTRDPAGLGGALKKIGARKHAARIGAPNAEEASHLFFANGLSSQAFSMFATHPPLKQRVMRIEPSFDGNFAAYAEAHPSELADVAAPAAADAEKPRAAKAKKARKARTAKKRGKKSALEAFFDGIAPANVTAGVGNPSPEHLVYAAGLLAAMSPQVRTAASDPFGARAVVYAMLLDERKDVRQKQLKILEEHADRAAYDETKRIAPQVASMDAKARLPLASISMPALKNMSPAQYKAFAACMSGLIKADERIDMHEFALARMVERHVAAAYSRPRQAGVKYHALKPLAPHIGALVSALAHLGSSKEDEVAAAYERGMAELDLKSVPAMASAAGSDLGPIGSALDVLQDSSPAIKRRVLAACVAAVTADGKVVIGEAELLRAVADSLDVPVPPFLSDSA